MSKKLKKAPRRKVELCGLAAYSTTCAESNSLESVLDELTDEALESGEYCEHTVSDLAANCRTLLERLRQRQRLFNLCVELDMEMDGVRCPASAAAILNAIRAIVTNEE